MLNHFTGMGRIVNDLSLKTTPNGVPVISFTIACERDFVSGGEKQCDFIDCVAWNKTAEFIDRYFDKGRMAIVSGRLQIRAYVADDGTNRRNSEIVVDKIYFGDPKTKAVPEDNSTEEMENADF